MTNFLCAKHILIFIFALLFIACSTNQPQYVDLRDFVSFGLDNHDIDDTIKKQVDSLLKQKIFKNQSEAQILTIGAIDNESGESIDIEIIANELTRHLSNSEKFVVVNAGRDKKIEQILRDSRKMRENAEYNQYTTIEQGNLIAPSYALTGKITKKNRKILDDEIIEYVFSFTLTDLKLGAVRWVGNEQIAKKLPKSEVKNFSVAVESNKVESRRIKSNVGELHNDSSAKNKIDLVESSGDSRKNHFIFGFDLGLFNIGFPKTNKFSIDLGGQTYIIASDKQEYAAVFPLHLRIGYLRNIGNWGIAVNAVYSYAYASLSESNWYLSNVDYAYQEDYYTESYALLQRVGGEIVAYYSASKTLDLYVGISMYKDIGSKLNVTLNAKYVNGGDSSKVRRKINGLYAGLKFGLLWYFSKYVGLTYEINVSVTRKSDTLSSGVGWAVFGLQWRI